MAKFEWAKELMHLDPLQIEHAIHRINLSGSEFPPSLPVFLKYAYEKEPRAPRGYRVVGQ